MSAYAGFAWFLLYLVLKTSETFVYSKQEFTLVKRNNMAHSKGKIRQLEVKSMNECFKKCLSECRCSSFDMRRVQSSPTDFSCTLRTYKNISKLSAIKGSSHFEIKQEPFQQCDANVRQCKSSINCCLSSNPCLNGAKCLPTDDIKERYRCVCDEKFTGKLCDRCAPGYTGTNCATLITSCQGHVNGSRISTNYHIRNVNDHKKKLKVFCEFENDTNTSWTLVQSYSLRNAQKFEKLLVTDFPTNPGNPLENWHSYRIPQGFMKSINSVSTKWRVTCDFDKDMKAMEKDSMRGSKKDLDIMTWMAFGECGKLDYINVRGYSCSDCTANLYNEVGYPLHFDSKRAQESDCDFKPGSWRNDCGEDNFGFYHCVNTHHRCSASQDSTTQTWLGG